MDYVWKQREGELMAEGKRLAGGYAGATGHVNKTASEGIKDKGPIPRGGYSITLIYPSHAKFGPYTCVLQPDRGNKMFGRSGFLIHGDSLKEPGTASEGCIILESTTRKKFRVGDRIQVV